MALYVEQSGVMRLAASVDLSNPGGANFSSHELDETAFRADNDTESAAQVVKCVRSRQTLIVEDCVRAADAGAFKFFRPEQLSHLRSMMTHHLGKVSQPDGSEVDAVIAVDTDEPGFFKESERSSLEFTLREFADRIKLELILQSLLHVRGAPK